MKIFTLNIENWRKTNLLLSHAIMHYSLPFFIVQSHVMTFFCKRKTNKTENVIWSTCYVICDWVWLLIGQPTSIWASQKTLNNPQSVVKFKGKLIHNIEFYSTPPNMNISDTPFPNISSVFPFILLWNTNKHFHFFQKYTHFHANKGNIFPNFTHELMF